MGVKLKGDSLRGFLFAFAGTSELLLLGSLLEFPRGRLGTNFVWRPFGSLLGFAIPGDSFSGIPPCFPPLGFTLIVCSRGTTFPPLVVYCSSPFLGNYISPQKSTLTCPPQCRLLHPTAAVRTNSTSRLTSMWSVTSNPLSHKESPTTPPCWPPHQHTFITPLPTTVKRTLALLLPHLTSRYRDSATQTGAARLEMPSPTALKLNSTSTAP